MARKKKDSYGAVMPPQPTHQEYRAKFGIQKLRGRNPLWYTFYNLLRLLSIVALIGLTIFFGSSYIKNRQLTDDLKEQLVASYDPAFKVRYEDLGEQIVRSWYEAGPQAVSVGKDIQWPSSPMIEKDRQFDKDGKPIPGAENLGVNSVSFVGGDRYEMNFEGMKLKNHNETLSYLVDINGRFFRVTITLAVEDDNPQNEPHPTLVSTPTIERYDVEQQLSNDLTVEPAELEDYPGELAAPIQSQIDIWARAYAEDARPQLKQVTQDSVEENIYTGLGGWTMLPQTKPEVKWARYGHVGTKRYLVVSVSFDITTVESATIGENSEVTPTGDGEKQEVYTNKQNMALLIDGADSGLPSIVAWGPEGEWATLEPKMNAIQVKKGQDIEDKSRTNSEELLKQISEATSAPASGSAKPSESESAKPSESKTPSPSATPSPSSAESTQ